MSWKSVDHRHIDHNSENVFLLYFVSTILNSNLTDWQSKGMCMFKMENKISVLHSYLIKFIHYITSVKLILESVFNQTI